MFVQRLTIQNQSVQFFGDGLYQAQVNHLNSFIIHPYSIIDRFNEVKIITYPFEYPCEIKLIDNHNGTWIVNYIPKEIGQIQIDLILNNQPINNIPFKINIFDINQIYISNLNNSFINQLNQFHIDTSKAGIGQLEVIVENGQVSCDLLSYISSQYDVTFLPHKSGLYKIDIKFNGLIIPDSPFSCSINDLSRVIVSNNITNAHVGHKLSFDIDNQSKSFDIYIVAPSGRYVSFQSSQLNENQTRIDYILDEIGLHQVNVRTNDNMNIYGSSFSLQAYDTNRIIVSDIPHSLVFNQPVEFIIDTSKAGEGELEVHINNGLIPTQVKQLGKLKFHFTFLPLLNELHRLSIKFNGQQLPGFPKECKIISSDNIKIQGPGINQVLLNTPTWFKIDIPHRDLSNLKLTIITPINEKLIPSTLLTSDGLQVDWTPTEIGTYNIQAIIDDKPILENPFHVKCYDPKKIIVIPPINGSSIHKPTKFLIDVSKAGEGNLEISVNCSGQNIPNQINSIGNRRFEFEFIPQKAMIHQCNILFNGEIVPGSPFSVNVMDMQCIMAIGKGLGSIPIHIPTSFTILSKKSLGNNLRCSIKGPDDHLISSIMTKLDPNRYEVTYIPNCVGEFRIEILYDNIPIDKSPFISRSFDVNKIQIQDFPFSTYVGSSTSFLIDATNSGSGNLEIAISRNGKNIPNYVQNEGGARFRIKFIPDQSSVHHVSIKFNGIEIHGSPFLCNVYSNEFLFENYEYTSIDKETLFSLKPKLNSMLNPNIYIDIITPSGKQIPKTISSINFIPNEIGQHEIRFYNNDEKKILLKKFLCQVYDINKIHISDLPIAIVRQQYKFTINTTDAGNVNLLVTIKQNEKKISHEQIQISTHIYEISFTPETSDDCTVQISFNDENNLRTLVIPVKIACDQIIISSIPSGIVGQPVIFTINLTELNLLSIVITESHSGKILSHTMTLKSSDKNQYQISFIPNIARQHTISITYDGKLISTHHIDVCNVNKIRVSSINDGIVGIPSIFSVDTHGAGEGHLEVTVSDGQRTLPAQLKTIQARKFDIAFVPEISGKHSINITFNGIPIEGNPFIINVQESSNDNSIEDDDNDDHEFIIGGQLQGTKVGEVAWLICETSLTDIYEDLDFYVTDPDEIIIKHTRIQDSAGRWRIEFEPKKSGIYQIQIDIDQTSMILASIEILPLNYERTIYGERIVHPNLLNYFSINSPNENLKIQLRSSNGKEIPLEIERDSLEWKIYFTLIEIDCYQLSITDDTNNEQLFEIHCVTEEIDLFRNGGIEDIARLIIDHSKISIGDINVIVKDSLAHTIPAAFYRNTKNDLIIEYIPVRKDIHEVFIRTQNNLLDICPIRIMSFQSKNTFDPVLRVQVKEFLEHTFSGVIDHDNKLEININDPFERSIPFQRSKNEQGELTISVLPVRVGTHWIRISNNENDSFALIPIFSFDDDYVPLSPIATPSIEKNQINNIQEFIPLARDLTTISETSEIASSSRTMSISPEHFIKSNQDNSMNISSIINDRMSPEVQILDINDLDDPCIEIQSKFSLQDPDDQFNILIYDANENKISHQIERLPDGRKSISYEPTIVGSIEIHILKDNQPIDGSPLIVHAFDPSNVQITNFPQKILMNKINTFSIDATKAGKGSLKITIKDSNNQSLPVNTEKKSNDQIVIQFQPTTFGKHIISILFNRIPIPKTPLEIFIENIEERGRSMYSKYDLLSFGQQQQKKLSLETIYSRTSNDNSSSLFNEQEIEKFHLLKTKFEHKQPLDLIFDPRQYPFKIYFQSSFPSINTDIHLSINLPHIISVNITINQLKIPLQIIHNNIQTPILKFRPIIAGDYSIILKDSHGKEFPYILPVYNPNGIHIEPFNHLQSINDCHFICNIDNIGQGKFFLMVYYQSKPIRISYKIQSLSKTSIQIRLFPLKIGTYRIYLAYRNLPINGKYDDLL